MEILSEEEIIKQFKHWIEYEKQHKDKINKADELIGIQQGLLDLYNKEKEKNKEIEKAREDGTLSDGYHTYNDLYYQRCILFATICNLNKDISWKSKKHSDGKKCFDSDNWFIVGIDTPKGSYTYHYEMKYWDLFNIKELELGKIWDGHTEKDVTRLLSLEKVREIIAQNKALEFLNFTETDYISKDKIKEKIKELEDRLIFEYALYEKAEEHSDTQYAIHRRINMLNFVIEVLKELLEEVE